MKEITVNKSKFIRIKTGAFFALAAVFFVILMLCGCGSKKGSDKPAETGYIGGQVPGVGDDTAKGSDADAGDGASGAGGQSDPLFLFDPELQFNPHIEHFSFIDERNGQRYRAVKIGRLVWMAENLNYAADSSWCYADEDSHCAVYGRLYAWNAAMEACPDGWRLPGVAEWGDLVQTAGGTNNAYEKLKSRTGWRGWEDGTSRNGPDELGFSAIPGGVRYRSGKFFNAGEAGSWWTSGEHQTDQAQAHYRLIGSNFSELFARRSDGHSVRCVRN